jgi:hypothetical protein
VVEPKKETPKDEGTSAAVVPFTFTLKTKSATGCLHYAGCGSDCATLHCLDDLTIEMKQNCPCACPAKVEFAAFVTAKKADGSEIFKNRPTGAVCILSTENQAALCSGKTADLKLNSRECDTLSKAIKKALLGLCKSDAPATLELVGCLRLTGCSGKSGPNQTCQTDYVKLPAITIKVTECPAPSPECPGCSPKQMAGGVGTLNQPGSEPTSGEHASKAIKPLPAAPLLKRTPDASLQPAPVFPPKLPPASL